jgi:hypothetical protein
MTTMVDTTAPPILDRDGLPPETFLFHLPDRRGRTSFVITIDVRRMAEARAIWRTNEDIRKAIGI